MKYLLGVLVLIIPSLLVSQEKITDAYSLKYQKDFSRIIDGELNGESFTAYLDYIRLSVDFDNDALADYTIPYTYTCFPRDVYTKDRYFYIHGQSTLVIDLADRKMHDHFTFSTEWFFRSAHSINGLDINILENNQGQFRYGLYDPGNKTKTLSNPHAQLFTYNDQYYFSDFVSGERIIGRFDLQNWTEEILYQGTNLNYLGLGLFRDEDGLVYRNVLESNPEMTCIPKEIIEDRDIIANRYLMMNNYTVIESYDDTLDHYNYYIGSGCDYQLFKSSNLIPLSFDFFNENYLGYRKSGKYTRIKYTPNNPSSFFSIASNEDYSVSDKWVMAGDTAYQFSRELMNGEYVQYISPYTPNGLDLDEKNYINMFSSETNMVRRRLNDVGNIEVTFNSDSTGVYAITYDPDGNEINSMHLFSSLFNNYDEKNAIWSSSKRGHVRKLRIANSEDYRIDRVEDGLVYTDTMLVSPYIDDEIQASIKAIGNDQVLELLDLNTSTSTRVTIPTISFDSFSRMIRVKDEIWIVHYDNTSNEDIISKYGLDGNANGFINFNFNKIIFHDDNGVLFIGSNDEFPSYLFYYDGEEVTQLSESLTSSAFVFASGNKHYLFSAFQDEIELYEFVPDIVVLNEVESFIGNLKSHANSLHNGFQSSKVFSIVESVEYSNTIKTIVFEDGNYEIVDIDLDESTFILSMNSFSFNGGQIYSVQDKFTNFFVNSNGMRTDLPIDLDEELLINDIYQENENVYLFVSTFFDTYVIKCDEEFNDCISLRNFDRQWCQYSQIELLGHNQNEVYFSSKGTDPIETIWTLDTSNDEFSYYNENEETQIQYFERRDFFQDGHVYFTAARSDKIHQLFRLKVSEGPNKTENTNIKNAFSIHPNPTASHTRIFSQSPLDKFTIYDSRGLKILQGQFDADGGYALPSLSSGFYFIHAQDKKGIPYVSKLVVVE